MDSNSKLLKVFVETLDIKEEHITDALEYNSLPEWDSVAHMKLVAAIESAFDIMLDTEDIIDMSSFKKAKEIVTKYEGRT